MTFYIRISDKEKHSFNLTDIGDNVTKDKLKEFIEKELKLIFFDISYGEPLLDKSVINIINPCKEISENKKKEYYFFLRFFNLGHNIYNYTAYFGHLECLKYACEYEYKNDVLTEKPSNCFQHFKKGLKCDEYICFIASKRGHLDCLRYAHENGFDWDKWTCEGAANGGHLDCLKYAHENGCEWDRSTFEGAARGGNLECLKYAHKNGCEWNIWMCVYSSEAGHLDCLKYAHENGCEWDKLICEGAAKNGHLDCLKYARKNNCEWDKDKCLEKSEDYPEIQSWILLH